MCRRAKQVISGLLRRINRLQMEIEELKKVIEQMEVGEVRKIDEKMIVFSSNNEDLRRSNKIERCGLFVLLFVLCLLVFSLVSSVRRLEKKM